MLNDNQEGGDKMTKKDFILIAEVIRESRIKNKTYLAELFADNLIYTNPLFDRNRFINACLKKEEKK